MFVEDAGDKRLVREGEPHSKTPPGGGVAIGPAYHTDHQKKLDWPLLEN